MASKYCTNILKRFKYPNTTAVLHWFNGSWMPLFSLSAFSRHIDLHLNPFLHSCVLFTSEIGASVLQPCSRRFHFQVFPRLELVLSQPPMGSLRVSCIGFSLGHVVRRKPAAPLMDAMEFSLEFEFLCYKCLSIVVALFCVKTISYIWVSYRFGMQLYAVCPGMRLPV